MIRKAAMAARNMPADASMLAAVAAASAGTISVSRTPNWANGASTRHEQETERSHESEPALGLVGRLSISCGRSASHLTPCEHEQRSA